MSDTLPAFGTLARGEGPGATAPAWRHAVPALAALLATVLFVYRDTAAAMVHIWSRSETFTHGFVVPVIVLWLVWRRRAALAAQVPAPSAAMLAPLAAAAALWFVGDLAAVNAATQLALTALLVGVVVAMVGWRAARVIAFPLGFLFFAVPIGEFMMPQLMVWTADFTAAALRLTGVPVYREGLQLVIPTGTWSIIEACSGIRYLIASVMAGTLFAYLHYRSLRRRLLFVGVSIAVPIVANWVRAYLIVMLGHVSNNQIATGADHLIYGWFFFGIVITLTFMIGIRWSEHPDEDRAARASASPRATAAVAPLPAATWATAAAVALLVVMPRAAVVHLSSGAPGAPAALAPASVHPSWRPAKWEGPDWKPAFSGAAVESQTAYATSDSTPVGVYVAYYRNQDYGRKLVNSENVLVRSDDEAWIVASQGMAELAFGSVPLSVKRAELRSRSVWTPDQRLTAWQFYWINGTLTIHDAHAKLYGAWHRARGRGDDAAAVVLYTQGAGHAAEERLREFLRLNLGALQAQLAATRNGAAAASP